MADQKKQDHHVVPDNEPQSQKQSSPPSNDPGRTPGKAEGDRQTVEEDWRSQRGNRQSS